MDLSSHLGEMKVWGWGKITSSVRELSVGDTLGIFYSLPKGSSWRKNLGVISGWIAFEVMSLGESLDDTVWMVTEEKRSRNCAPKLSFSIACFLQRARPLGMNHVPLLLQSPPQLHAVPTSSSNLCKWLFPSCPGISGVLKMHKENGEKLKTEEMSGQQDFIGNFLVHMGPYLPRVLGQLSTLEM